MRKVPLITGEIYHLYNRGVEKRNIFSESYDIKRFVQSIEEFNTPEPIGSIYAHHFQISDKKKDKPLIKLIAYCFNPNHFHLIVEQMSENGISLFMHRLGTGYTNFFNAKYRRSGALFQGRFKSAHIAENDDLLRLSVYVNLNDKIHQLINPTPKPISSWGFYYRNKNSCDLKCEAEVILEQFKNRKGYENFAKDLLPVLIEKKEGEREFLNT